MILFILVRSCVLRGIFPISDKFRIVGLAEHAGGTQADLLADPEFVSMFLFHNVKPLGMEGEREVISSKVYRQQLTHVHTCVELSQSVLVHFMCIHNIQFVSI